MKPCEKRWAMMRKAVDDRGMSHLVKGATENHQAMVEEMQGEKDSQFFDPLMGMFWRVMNKALKQGGLYLMTQKPDGTEYCPICEAMLHPCTCGDPLCLGDTPKKVEVFWIEGPANSHLQEALKRGLLTRN